MGWKVQSARELGSKAQMERGLTFRIQNDPVWGKMMKTIKNSPKTVKMG